MESERREGQQYVGVSTKMYLGYQQSLDWLTAIRREVMLRAPQNGVAVFVAPAFPLLESAGRILSGTGVILGAQNCSVEGGALTGEVSAELLAEMGVGLVVIGHAERRRLLGENEETIARKVTAAAAANITPLLCIGEHERTMPSEAAAFCMAQVESALEGGVATDAVVLAYEPVWAIGAPNPAPAEYVNDVAVQLRALLRHSGSKGSIRMIYGGSAGPGLLPELKALDGLFLGRFAHDPSNFGLVLDDALAVADARHH